MKAPESFSLNQPGTYRFDLFEKGKAVESVEVVCRYARLAQMQVEISDELNNVVVFMKRGTQGATLFQPHKFE